MRMSDVYKTYVDFEVALSQYKNLRWHLYERLKNGQVTNSTLPETEKFFWAVKILLCDTGRLGVVFRILFE